MWSNVQSPLPQTSNAKKYCDGKKNIITKISFEIGYNEVKTTVAVGLK